MFFFAVQLCYLFACNIIVASQNFDAAHEEGNEDGRDALFTIFKHTTEPISVQQQALNPFMVNSQASPRGSTATTMPYFLNSASSEVPKSLARLSTTSVTGIGIVKQSNRLHLRPKTADAYTQTEPLVKDMSTQTKPEEQTFCWGNVFSCLKK